MDYLTWIISIVSIYQLYLAGNKHKNTWVLTFFNQILWFVFIFHSGEYGLLPLTTAYTLMAVRNHFKWNK